MNKRTLNRDLLVSGTYRQRVVKAKKGKGAYQRPQKHRKQNDCGVFLWVHAQVSTVVRQIVSTGRAE